MLRYAFSALHSIVPDSNRWFRKSDHIYRLVPAFQWLSWFDFLVRKSNYPCDWHCSMAHRSTASRVAEALYFLVWSKSRRAVGGVSHRGLRTQSNVLVAHERKQWDRITLNVLTNRYSLNLPVHVGNASNSTSNRLIVWIRELSEGAHRRDEWIDYRCRGLVDMHVLH